MINSCIGAFRSTFLLPACAGQPAAFKLYRRDIRRETWKPASIRYYKRRSEMARVSFTNHKKRNRAAPFIIAGRRLIFNSFFQKKNRRYQPAASNYERCCSIAFFVICEWDACHFTSPFVITNTCGLSCFFQTISPRHTAWNMKARKYSLLQTAKWNGTRLIHKSQKTQ